MISETCQPEPGNQTVPFYRLAYQRHRIIAAIGWSQTHHALFANHYFRCKVSPPITAWFWDWLFLFQTCETNPNEAPGYGGGGRGVARQFDSSCTQQRKQMQAPSDLPVPIDEAGLL
jgi:hypothetical protein